MNGMKYEIIWNNKEVKRRCCVVHANQRLNNQRLMNAWMHGQYQGKSISSWRLESERDVISGLCPTHTNEER